MIHEPSKLSKEKEEEDTVLQKQSSLHSEANSEPKFEEHVTKKSLEIDIDIDILETKSVEKQESPI
jgi:hypothetical protein